MTCVKILVIWVGVSLVVAAAWAAVGLWATRKRRG